MEENKNCILLKRKEYDELVKLANSKKPDIITVKYFGGKYIPDRSFDISYTLNGENIDISSNISSQIRRIIRKYEEGIMNNLEDRINEIESKFAEKLKPMGLFKLHSFIANYGNNS